MSGRTWRTEVRPADADAVRAIVASTGFFSAAEIDIAVELVEARLADGDASGYFFLLAEEDAQVIGYACYGPIAGTVQRYDLYWIAVDAARQRAGLGSALLRQAEQAVAAAGGARIYVQTSTRPQYQSTRAFYERNGYALAAELPDYYADGDGQAIYVKRL